jgi:hypothetical protein
MVRRVDIALALELTTLELTTKVMVTEGLGRIRGHTESRGRG